MPTYYEILEVSPQASNDEIEAALDRQYTHWRRQVTSHMPEVVSRANDAMQSLEKIRATLTDAGRRSLYDEMIGVQGTLGGLADPTAVLTGSAPPVPPPPSALVMPASTIPSEVVTALGAAAPSQPFVSTPTPVSPLSEAELRQARAIENSLAQVHGHIQVQRYGLALAALDGFEGLSPPKSSTSTICRRDNPRWLEAQALYQQATAMPNKLATQMMLFTVPGYAVVGFLLLPILASTLGQYWLANPVIRILIGGILGAVGPWLYYRFWGGKSSITQDRLLGALMPLALGIALTVGVVVVVIVVVLFLLSLFAGAG